MFGRARPSASALPAREAPLPFVHASILCACAPGVCPGTVHVCKCALKERFWRYLWDKNFTSPRYPMHHVRVTYKTKLTDKATDKFPEFKPFVEPMDGSQQRLHTDPHGIEFMLQLPEVNNDPGVEAWTSFAAADDEREKKGWNLKKVKKDVLETANIDKFPKAEVDVWNALFKFHETYTTADAIPASPRVLPVGEGATASQTPMTLTGMPIAWSDMWGKLRGR
eukprot:5617417-Pleurochrysis_carterae.AAC.1